jgi:hypothetical protein
MMPQFRHVENQRGTSGWCCHWSFQLIQGDNCNVNAPQAIGFDRVRAKETAACTAGFISQRLLLAVAFLASIFAALALSACGPKTALPPKIKPEFVEERTPPPRPPPSAPKFTPLRKPTLKRSPTILSLPKQSATDTEREVEDQEEVPEFPWPPPKASASDTIPRELLVDNTAHPLVGTVARAIESAFQQAGYGEKSYYSVPGGFAMASRMEQMNQDGSSKASADRWSLEVPRMSTFSLSLYLTALFRGRPGYYRVIVFVVTPQPFWQSSAKITSEDAGVWVSSGLNKLPEKMANQEYSPAHTCTALIYEFKRTEGRRAEFVDPSEITGPTHLEKSGLMAAFAKRR